MEFFNLIGYVIYKEVLGTISFESLIVFTLYTVIGPLKPTANHTKSRQELQWIQWIWNYNRIS